MTQYTIKKDIVILKKGTIISIPNDIEHQIIMDNLAKNKIVVNIPEFRLRIFHEDLMVYSSLIRVGRNESKYLKSIDKYSDLRTKTGHGRIVKTEKNPNLDQPC